MMRGAPSPTRRRHCDRIAAGLRDDIVRGRYQAGERLPAERELASRLAVNRGSVREALKQLEQLGLVEIRRGDGALVRPLREASIDVVRDLLRTGDVLERRVLEEMLDVHEMLLAGATALAVEDLSDAALARARGLVAELAAPEHTALDFYRRVEQLVEIAVEASGHLVLRLFQNAVQPAIVDGLREIGARPLGADPHLAAAARDLDAALAARTPEAAAAAVRRLSKRARMRLARALDVYEAERGVARGSVPPA